MTISIVITEPEISDDVLVECWKQDFSSFIDDWNPMILAALQLRAQMNRRTPSKTSNRKLVPSIYKLEFHSNSETSKYSNGLNDFFGAKINIYRVAYSYEEAYLIFREYLLNETLTVMGNPIDLISEDLAMHLFLEQESMGGTGLKNESLETYLDWMMTGRSNEVDGPRIVKIQ